MKTDGIISLISTIRDEANDVIAEQLAQRGITGMVTSHGNILNKLYEHGSLPMNQLASLIGKKKNTVTVLVEKLKTAGYVELRKSSDDGRVTYVELTNKGEDIQQQFQEISHVLLMNLWGDMPLSDREHLVLELGKVAHNVKSKCRF